MGPEPTRVAPERLATLGNQLANAGKVLEDSLGNFVDPAMWMAADLYKDYFGPATNVAEIYASMAKKLPDYVHSASQRLNHGAEVFHEAATGFAGRDQNHGDQMRQAGPR